MHVLSNANIVTPTGMVHGSVSVQDGRIIDIAAGGSAAGTLDVAGSWLIPGFVDMHVHGGGGGSFPDGDAEGAARAARYHLRHGTTSLIAGLVTASVADMAHHVGVLADLCQDGVLAGIHLEGPYLAPSRCGAHDPAHLRPPDAAELLRLITTARGFLRMVTIAPERSGALDVIRLCRDHQVVAAIGHTDATYQQTKAGLAAGATVATHLFNGMRPLHHREPGPTLALLEDPRVEIELVVDGNHLAPAVVSLALAHAGARRIALVTDCISAAGLEDGHYTLGPTDVTVADGTARVRETGSLAGSTQTMDRAFRFAVDQMGDIFDAVQMTATGPARAVGISDRVGSIVVGKQADLLVLTDSLQVARVMKAGHWLDPVPVPSSF